MPGNNWIPNHHSSKRFWARRYAARLFGRGRKRASRWNWHERAGVITRLALRQIEDLSP